MDVDHNSPLHPHEQIAAWLRQRIEHGDLPPGSRLPSESTIAQEWGVAVTTVRRSIALLRREGLVYTVAGRGSFARALGDDPES